MISRLLSIAAVSLLVAQGPAVAFAAEDAALVHEVQGLLIKRGYLKDYHKEWDQCSQRAAAAFLSDKGEMGTVPELPDIAQELKKPPPMYAGRASRSASGRMQTEDSREIGAAAAVHSALPKFSRCTKLSGAFDQQARLEEESP